MANNGYISYPIVVDASAIIQKSFQEIANNIPGWIPREGNLEVALLEQFAIMSSQAASLATDVPGTIFRYFGPLVGITPKDGVAAQIYTTWTLTAPAGAGGYTIPAGTPAVIYYGGVAYQYGLVSELVFTEGDNSKSNVLMEAVEVGVSYNIGSQIVNKFLDPVAGDFNIANILITATPETVTPSGALSFGEDPESDTAFMNRLAAELQLLAPRPITPSDYAQLATNINGVYRALVQDGFDPFSNQIAAATAQPTAATGWSAIGFGTGTKPTIAYNASSPQAIKITGASITNSGTVSGSITTGATSVSPTGFANLSNVTSNEYAIMIFGNALASPNGFTYEFLKVKGCTSGTISFPTGVTVANSYIGGAFVQQITYVNSAATANSRTLNVSDRISMTINSSNPCAFLIVDPTNGNEVILATSTNTSTNTITLNLAAPLMYAHGVDTYVVPLQGAIMSSMTVDANCEWYQFGAFVKADSANTEFRGQPIAGAFVTYYDGSTDFFWDFPRWELGLRDYSSKWKQLAVEVSGTSIHATSSIAPSSSAAYNSKYSDIYAGIYQVQPVVLYWGIPASSIHYVKGALLRQTDFDFAGDDDINNISTEYNFVPDANLGTWSYGTAATIGDMSWTLTQPSAGTCLYALPSYGLQITGLATAIGTAASAITPSFRLQAKSDTDNNITSRYYTAFASISTSDSIAAQGKVTLSVINSDGDAVYSTATMTNTNGETLLLIPFNISSTMDSRLKVEFASTLNLGSGQSIIIRNIGLIGGQRSTANDLPYKYKIGFQWIPGTGAIVAGAFNTPRTVTIAPIDVYGRPVSNAIADQTADMLESKREINFTVDTIQPNYVPIDVTWTGVAMSGYNATSVRDKANKLLYAYLSPANWAGGSETPPYWDGAMTSITSLSIAGVLTTTPGLSQVTSVVMRVYRSTNSGAYVSEIDLADQNGFAPLPIGNNITGSVQANPVDNAIGGIG